MGIAIPTHGYFRSATRVATNMMASIANVTASSCRCRLRGRQIVKNLVKSVAACDE